MYSPIDAYRDIKKSFVEGKHSPYLPASYYESQQFGEFLDFYFRASVAFAAFVNLSIFIILICFGKVFNFFRSIFDKFLKCNEKAWYFDRYCELKYFDEFSHVFYGLSVTIIIFSLIPQIIFVVIQYYLKVCKNFCKIEIRALYGGVFVIFSTLLFFYMVYFFEIGISPGSNVRAAAATTWPLYLVITPFIFPLVGVNLALVFSGVLKMVLSLKRGGHGERK